MRQSLVYRLRFVTNVEGLYRSTQGPLLRQGRLICQGKRRWKCYTMGYSRYTYVAGHSREVRQIILEQEEFPFTRNTSLPFRLVFICASCNIQEFQPVDYWVPVQHAYQFACENDPIGIPAYFSQPEPNAVANQKLLPWWLLCSGCARSPWCIRLRKQR
jgi:hypothetical protein